MNEMALMLHSHTVCISSGCHESNMSSSCTHPQFLVIRNTRWYNVDKTNLMCVKPLFLHEVGKDFRKWENGGREYYHHVGKIVKILVSSICM